MIYEAMVTNIKLYCLKELAEISGVPVRTWYAFIADGRLPASRIGRRLCVTREDLLEFIKKNREERAEAAAADAAKPTDGAKG
jgi:excisionase family DNA binding protein